jgi:hypothetical protein
MTNKNFIILGITSSLAGSFFSKFTSTSQIVGFVRPLVGDDNVSNLKRKYRESLDSDSHVSLVDYNGSDD